MFAIVRILKDQLESITSTSAEIQADIDRLKDDIDHKRLKHKSSSEDLKSLNYKLSETHPDFLIENRPSLVK